MSTTGSGKVKGGNQEIAADHGGFESMIMDKSFSFFFPFRPD